MVGSIMVWMAIGTVIGALGRAFMPANDPGGFVATILLGIAGALLGGFLTTAVSPPEFEMASGWSGAGVGAVALLLIYKFVMKSRH